MKEALDCPNETPPLNLDEVTVPFAPTLGKMDMRGNPEFDCDSIAQTDGPERRWHSFPGGCLCLNPASHLKFVIDPTPPDLSLDLGGYVGTGVLRLPKVVRMALAHGDGTVMTPVSQRTNWFPHKLGLHAMYEGGATIDAEDYFVDEHSSLLRVIEVRNANSLQLQLSAEMTDINQQWWAAKKTILVTGKDYHYSLCFVGLAQEGRTSQNLSFSPVCTALGWKLDLPIENGANRFAIGFGFSTREEGAIVAMGRARLSLARPVAESLARAREVTQSFLRKVPAPTQWNLQPELAKSVTPDQQRHAYYMAWTFVHQSLINLMPENPKYPYPQMSVGKGSLWADGEEHCPATCAWESLMAIQWLTLVDPETAWNVYIGIMTLVDNDGLLGGESLPSRKAETAWKLYQHAPNRKRLEEVYPAIKRYLLWREANPRWIWGDMKAVDERDLEFLASWLYDLEFAEKIANELGLEKDAELWRSKVAPGIRNMRDWFFRDPQRVHQLYFTDSKAHNTPKRSSERPIMILSALRVRSLPDDMASRLIVLFRELAKPGVVNAGFNYSKYPDNQLVALGLLERGLPDARPFVEAILRDSIRAEEFAECLVEGPENRPALEGVKPSLFTALNIIDFTLLLNQVRYDAGRPVAFSLQPHPRISHEQYAI